MSNENQEVGGTSASAAAFAAQAGADAPGVPEVADTTAPAAAKTTKVRSVKQVASAAPTAPAARTVPEGVDVAEAVKYVDITLEESDEIPPTGQYFGVNGTGYLLLPGVRASVPEFLLEVLDNATASKPITDQNGQITGYRDVTRFPYKVHRK